MFLKVIRSHMAALSHTWRMLPSICILVLSVFQFVALEAVSQCVDGVSLSSSQSSSRLTRLFWHRSLSRRVFVTWAGDELGAKISFAPDSELSTLHLKPASR